MKNRLGVILASIFLGHQCFILTAEASCELPFVLPARPPGSTMPDDYLAPPLPRWDAVATPRSDWELGSRGVPLPFQLTARVYSRVLSGGSLGETMAPAPYSSIIEPNSDMSGLYRWLTPSDIDGIIRVESLTPVIDVTVRGSAQGPVTLSLSTENPSGREPSLFVSVNCQTLATQVGRHDGSYQPTVPYTVTPRPWKFALHPAIRGGDLTNECPRNRDSSSQLQVPGSFLSIDDPIVEGYTWGPRGPREAGQTRENLGLEFRPGSYSFWDQRPIGWRNPGPRNWSLIDVSTERALYFLDVYNNLVIGSPPSTEPMTGPGTYSRSATIPLYPMLQDELLNEPLYRQLDDNAEYSVDGLTLVDRLSDTQRHPIFKEARRICQNFWAESSRGGSRRIENVPIKVTVGAWCAYTDNGAGAPLTSPTRWWRSDLPDPVWHRVPRGIEDETFNDWMPWVWAVNKGVTIHVNINCQSTD